MQDNVGLKDATAFTVNGFAWDVVPQSDAAAVGFASEPVDQAESCCKQAWWKLGAGQICLSHRAWLVAWLSCLPCLK
jgi:hypothetical protein